jgi:glycosyltransferase involved in cell wall biosynthesis
MLISIVTPSFSQGRYIDEITGPVRSQDHSRVESILVIDGSTDGTGDIRKKHENRRAGWNNEHDKGQTDVITGNMRSWKLLVTDSKIRRFWSPS